jgi:tetratricopeptide (TPR) repeat protein
MITGLFNRLFGRHPSAARARRAELHGDLPRAIELWSEADRPDEVARLMILRGDAEPDVGQRLLHYAQAAATVPFESVLARSARVKRASLTLLLARDVPVSATARSDLLEAAKELEAAGEAQKAADAYALVHDIQGEARALTQAGDVDRLETLLAKEHDKDQEDRRRQHAHAEIDDLLASGRRREALAAAERLVHAAPLDSAASERIKTLRARRLMGPVSRIMLSGKPVRIVWGDEVIIGRTEGSLIVRSTAMSRKHAAISRVDDRVVFRDLASRNGTRLRGMRIADLVPVGDALEVQLAGEVTLRVTPSAVFDRGVDIQIAGESYVAPLGKARLGVGEWRLECADDGWIELVTDDRPPAYRGALAFASRTTLLAGDALATTRAGETALQILGIG